MTKVAIVPVQLEGGTVTYRALAGGKQSQGQTAGEALDALTAQLSPDDAGTLIVVQSPRPDRFFGAEQIRRLSELMDRWRAAVDGATALSEDEQSELETLVEAELRASGERASALADEIGR